VISPGLTFSLGGYGDDANPSAGSTQHERQYQLGISYVQAARRALWVFAILALLASLATAQSTSSLNGSVTDPSGAAVAGAKITLTEPATGSQRTSTSNASGLYQFLEVPPGNYRLEAAASGFAPFVASKVTLVVKTPIERDRLLFAIL
jgi:hypothetical protein